MESGLNEYRTNLTEYNVISDEQNFVTSESLVLEAGKYFLFLQTKNEMLKNISATELKHKIEANESLFLLDIREQYEREIASIPSEHIPMAEVPVHAAEFPKEKEIVVICRSGRRAVPVADLLQNDFGLPNVSILEGGLLAWKDQIDPTLDIE